MASWTALNVAGGDTRDSVALERATEEAQDADNAAMYGQALRCQQHQQVDKARQIYQELLNGDVAVNTRLEYLCNKNLATMEFEDHKYEEALEYFAEALALDATDVVVWYQMATTAIETGKLWLARRTLEEGIKVDSTYWPLVATLAEVLHEIGDIDEYGRMAAYIRANDPQCASIRIIDGEVASKRSNVTEGFTTISPTVPLQAKRKRPRPSVRDLKLLNRAQRRLDHLHEISEDSAKRRKVLHEEMSRELKMAIEPRQYHLQSPSWMTLGKLLLEAFEDANRDTRINVMRASVDIEATFERQHATSAIAENPCADDANTGVKQKTGNVPISNNKNISRAPQSAENDGNHPPPAKRTKNQELVSLPNCVDTSTNVVSTGASDNDTQESVHASEVDEPQPTRRKSRRNEERLREEHAAAIKKAREKDLAYRLGAFLPKNADDSAPETVSLKWLLPLNVELVDTKFRVSNEAHETLAQLMPFASPSLSDEPESGASSQSEHRNLASQEVLLPVPLAECITGEQIAAFLIHDTARKASHGGVLDWVRRYLNQCGQWAQMKLGGDDEDIHQVFTWLEKVMNGELDASNPTAARQYGAVIVADHSLLQGSRFEGNGLTLSTQLFMLELHFDMLLQQPARRKRRRKLRKQIEAQVGQASRLLFEFSWLEDSDEKDEPCHPTAVEFLRLLWLIARMHERCGNPQMAQNYYSKCRDRLHGIVEERIDDADGSVFRLVLPNQKTDNEITLEILNEKISGLRFSDVCSEARRLSVKGDHDRVISLLLGHFFPANQSPRLIDFLNEFEVDEDGSQAQENGKMLFEMVLESLKQSSKFSDDDVVLLLLTTLYHVLIFLEGLSVEPEPSTSQGQPDEVCANALAALNFLLTRLSESHCDSITSRSHRLLLCALSMRCLEPSILLRFDTPSTVLVMLRAMLEAAKPEGLEDVGDGQMIAIDAMARLFYIIRSLSNEDLRKLFALESHPVKRKQPRRDRVRVVLVELLRYLNLMFQSNEELARSFLLAKRSSLMTLCCAMMKEEEETVAQSDSKTARQLFGNGAILFVVLYESFHRPSPRTVPTQLVELIHLLHERLGQHGICGLTYIPEMYPSHADARGGACFLESCMLLLSKFMKHVDTHEKSPGGEKSSSESVGDDTDDNNDEEELESEDLFKKAVCQCFRCLYDVQILPGCDDHKTGNTFASLQNEKQLTKHADAMRLARFAVPILLSTKPKTNGQKKENLKLLYAVRDALSDSSFAIFFAQPPKASPPLLRYLSPKGLLQWEDPLPFPFDGSEGKEQSVDEDCLSHLWYLLGANFILGRVKRRGNLSELKEMEQHVKERVEYLIKDVLYYHPDRVDSWIRLGKTMKELYHAATDAFAAVLGRKLRVETILVYTRKGCVQNPEKPAAMEDKELKDPDNLSFGNVVMGWNLFEKMKEWQDRNSGGHGSSGKSSSASKEQVAKDEDQDCRLQYAVPMEEFATAYIAQVTEFSRRCFAMAARLSEASAQKCELKLQLKRGSDGNDDEDGNFDEELDNLRNTVIECNEECGLLLFNVLQEFSLMKEVDLVHFPNLAFSRMIEQALAYFRKGMEICEGDDDANEVRFRLLYMIGKTLKKKRWCELRQKEMTDPEALDTAKEMAESFSKAEAAREEGDMEHALVHAFYALQGLRADLILSESPSVSALQLVCDHYFEEEKDEEEDEEDEEEEDSNNGGPTTTNKADKTSTNLKSSSKGVATSEDASSSNCVPDDTNAASPTKKDEILALLLDNQSDNFTREVNVTLARGWLALNIIDALESIPNEDRYFHPSRYVLARVVYWLSNFHNVLTHCGYKDSNISALVEAVEVRRGQVKMDGPSDAAARAVKEMAPLFDKRRPQVVAIWFSEYIPTAKKFEELNQRQMKYDYYRLKYWRFYIGMLQENMAYARLKEVGTWVLACKEEHDVISIMLGIVLQARGKVLRARLQGVMDTMRSTNVEVTATSESTDSMRPQLLGVDQLVDAVLKQLAKAYTYYLEVVDAQPRLTQVMEGSGLLLENAELPMVAVFFMGVTAYPSQMLLLEKDMVLMDRDFLNNVTVIKNALRRNELPPRIYDAEDREAWRKYLDAARSFCEEKWPERSGKGKVAKSRSRMKPSGGSTSETNTSQPAPDASS